MNDTSNILQSLKKIMKSKSVNYKALGKALNLSEPSVKRLFSQRSFSIMRLEKACQFLELDMSELILQSLSRSGDSHYLLNLAQEEELASNMKLLVVFYLLINDWSLKKIQKNYLFKTNELERLLLRLDKLNLIEYHSEGRVKLLFRRRIKWSSTGPLQRLLNTISKTDFLKSSFERKEERFIFKAGELSFANYKRFIDRMEKLHEEFIALAEVDALLPKEDTLSIGFLAAARPWILTEFFQIKKTADSNMSQNYKS